MKRKFLVKGYAFNLKKEVNRVYYEGEIFIHEGKAAELNGECMCVAHRFSTNPRFRSGEYTIAEITD